MLRASISCLIASIFICLLRLRLDKPRLLRYICRLSERLNVNIEHARSLKLLIPLFMIACISFSPINVEGKKIKNSFFIEKKKENKKGTHLQDLTGRKIEIVEDSILGIKLNSITFSGFDKEVNSSRESFLVTNGSEIILTGIEIRIDYLDMEGRMLHSNIVREKCHIPAGETRRIDIKSWDTQHTYYYHLGNEPKKVATPFNVKITPIFFWIVEQEN